MADSINAPITEEVIIISAPVVVGEIGAQGAQGTPGLNGLQGIDGHSPVVGISGDQITIDGQITGDHLTGPQGIKGDVGPQGIKGDVGPQGIKGDTGPQGIKGDVGPQGIKGDVGPQGIKGDVGPQGIKGDVGSQGIKGDVGSQGIKGDTGPQGIKGDTGPQGIKGDTGPPGTTDYNYLTNKPTIPSALSALSDDTNNRRVSDTEKSTWNGKQNHSTALDNVSGVNTGDQDLSGLVSKSTTVNGHDLNSNITISGSDIQVSQIGTPSTVDTLSDFFNLGWSAGVVSGGNITDNGDGSINISSGEGILRSSADTHAPIYSSTFSGITADFPADGATTYYFIDYNAGSFVIRSSTIITSFNCLDKCHLYTISREGTNLFILDAREQNVDSNRKARKRNYETAPFAHAPGGTILGASGLFLSLTAGVFYFSYVRIPHGVFDTSLSGTTVDRVIMSHWQNGSGGWNYSATDKQVNNLKYDDTTGTLHDLDTNHFGVRWIYLILGIIPKFSFVYDTGNYALLTDAKNAGVPASLPPSILTNGVLVGRCIVQKSASSLSDVSSSFNVSFVPSSASLPSVAGANGQVQYNLNGVLAADAQFTWDSVSESLNISGATILTDNPVAISGASTSGFLQVNLQNRTATDSADYVITADLGNNNALYADLGIGNSNYSSSVWDAVVPYDTYLFGDGGNVVLASLSVGKKINHYIAQTEHEIHPADLVVSMDVNGIDLPAGKHYRENGLSMKAYIAAMSTSMAMGGF